MSLGPTSATRIRAIAATRPIAERLGLALGSACLSVERWTWRTE